MHYSVLLQFDKKSENSLINIWKHIESITGNTSLFDAGLQPHITLASFSNTNIASFCQKLNSFTKKTNSFRLRFENTGTFKTNPDVIFLSPIINNELINIYNEFYKFFNNELEGLNSHCLPQNWTPHCTMSIKLSSQESSNAYIELSKKFKPMDVKINKLALIKCDKTKEYIVKCQLI